MRRRWRVALVFLGALGFLVAACESEEPTFVRDQRLTIEYPPPGETVSAPFELRWSFHGPQPTGFAVFVNRNPIAPGMSMEEYADEDDECARNPRCPTERWFAARGIYLTNDNAVEIPRQARPRGTGGRTEHPVHRATIIPLYLHERRDGATFLRRDGEVFWTVEYRQPTDG